MGKKETVQAEVIQKEVPFDPNPQPTSKDRFNYQKQRFLADERLWEQDEEKQKETIGKFFDMYGVPYLGESGISGEEKISTFRDKFIAETFDQIPRKKKEVSEPLRVAYEPPSWLEGKPLSESLVVEPDVIKAIVDTGTVEKEEVARKAMGLATGVPTDFTIPTPEDPIEEAEAISKEPKLAAKQSDSDVTTQIRNQVEEIYQKKGWPSPMGKVQAFYAGAADLQRQVQTGRITPEDYEKQTGELLRNIGLGQKEDGSVYVFPNELKLYQEQLERQYRKHLRESGKKEKDSFFKDFMDALNIGSAEVLNSGVRFLAMSEKAANGVLNLMGQKEEMGSTHWQDRAKLESEMLDSWREVNERYDESIVDYVKQDKMGPAVGQVFLSAGEALPLLTVLVAGNAAGATNVTLGYMGADKAANEYLRSEEDPDMSEFTRIVNALGKGLSEPLFESMGTVRILNSVKRSMAIAGKEAVRREMIKAYTPFLQRQMAILSKGTNAMLQEGAEEFGTQLTDNMMDVASGVMKFEDLGEGVVESTLVGGLLGFGLGSPAMISEATSRNAYIRKVAKSIPQELDLDAKLYVGSLILENDKLLAEMAEAPEAMKGELKNKIEYTQGLIDDIIARGTFEPTEVAPDVNTFVENVRDGKIYDEMKPEEEEVPAEEKPAEPELVPEAEPPVEPPAPEKAPKEEPPIPEPVKAPREEPPAEPEKKKEEPPKFEEQPPVPKEAPKEQPPIEPVKPEEPPKAVEKPEFDEAKPWTFDTQFMDKAQLIERKEVATKALQALDKMEKEGITGAIKDADLNLTNDNTQQLLGPGNNKIASVEDIPEMRARIKEAMETTEEAIKEREAMPEKKEGVIRYGGREFANVDELAKELAKYPTERLPLPEMDINVVRAIEKATEIREEAKKVTEPEWTPKEPDWTFKPKDDWQNNLIKAREYAGALGIDFREMDLPQITEAINEKIKEKPTGPKAPKGKGAAPTVQPEPTIEKAVEEKIFKKEYYPLTLPGVKLITVEGDAVRKELDPDFQEGATWKEKDYIPENEIWVDVSKFQGKSLALKFGELFEGKPAPVAPEEVDVDAEVTEMVELLQDIEFTDEELAMGSGTEIDNRTKLLDVATKVMEKYTGAGLYDFDGIMKQLAGKMPKTTLIKLLPFLKQSYSGYWSVAPENVNKKMDPQKAREYQESNLDDITPTAPEPQVKPPAEEAPEETEEIQKTKDLADKYIKINKPNTADELRKLAAQGLTPQEYSMLEQQFKKDEYFFRLKEGETMPKPLAPRTVNIEGFINILNRSQKQPYGSYAMEAVSEMMLNEVHDIFNKSEAILAELGLIDTSEMDWIESVVPNTSMSLLLRIGEVQAEKGDVRALVGALPSNIKEDKLILESLKATAFKWDLKNSLYEKETPKDFRGLVKMAERWGLTNKTVIRETAESAIVDYSRRIAQDKSITPTNAYNGILNVYQGFPTLSFRTNEIKDKQQYSTPVPMAYMMGHYVNGQEVGSLLEPSAGNGALLINVKKEAVRANDIDAVRRANLEQAGYVTGRFDSLSGLQGKFDIEPFDAVIMNPPFGGQGGKVDGYNLRKEYYTVAQTLKQMKNDGKAAIIVGGHVEFKDNGQMAGNDLYFFNYLNKFYNVEDVIQVPGEFYRTMGASYPVKIILINGRKAAPEGAAPLKSEAFEPIESWQELYDRIDNLTTKPNEKSVLQSKVDADRRANPPLVSPTPGPRQYTETGPVRAVPGREDPVPDTTGEPSEPPKPDRAEPGPVTRVGPGRAGEADIGEPTVPEPVSRPAGPGTRKATNRGYGEIRTKRDIPTVQPIEPGELPGRTRRDVQLKEREGDETEEYNPLSKAYNADITVPASMASETEDALMDLQDDVGDIDQYVTDKLGYPTIDQTKEALYAHQIDGAGMAVYNIEHGQSMIVGDQTGTGKGRIAASIAKYAHEQGKVPVFITKDADLFTDFYRDMQGIGSEGLRPFIVNKSFPTGGRVKIFHPKTGEVMYDTKPAETKRIISKGAFPREDYDIILASYSQFNSKERDVEKRQFLRNLGNDAIFIMDEAHYASGQSNTGEFFKEFVMGSGGGVFLSATYAKRPDNMPLYALKSVMSEANMTMDELVDAIIAGGPALQEILSATLSENLQFVRRGLEMKGVEVNYLAMGDTDPESPTYDPEMGKEMRRRYDGVTRIMNEIIQFQKRHVNPIIEGMDAGVKMEGKQIEITKGTSEAGIKNSQYFSKVYNVIDQLLLAIKVKEALPMIIKDLESGRKPVIALTSTMESMLSEMDLQHGMEVDMDFSEVLLRGLRGVMRYTEIGDTGDRTQSVLDPTNLSEAGKATFYELSDKIKEFSSGVPLSPIDVLIKGITDAGYQVAEITGRKLMFELNDDMSRGTQRANPRGNKTEMVRKFNNEPGWAAIINIAGSTGISMHSDPQFKDTNQRVQYVLQNHPDVNVLVQIRGRVYRANQVNMPVYNNITSVLPAELRLFMMNKKKLKSLDANTTSNQKQSKTILDAIDWLNKYGDQVVVEYLEENPDINEMIGDPLKLTKGKDRETDNAAHRVTSRMQITPTDIQEQFNDDITERYNTHIEYLNSTGQNDLMVTNENLNAEIKSREVSIQGLGGKSAFGDDTVLETVEVDVQKKPLTKAQLDLEIENTLQGMTPEEYLKDIRERMNTDMRKKLDENLAKIHESYEAKKLKKRKEAETRQGDLEDKERWLNEQIEDLEEHEQHRVNVAENIFMDNKEAFERYLRFFYPGKVLEVPFDESDDLELGTVRMNKGVFLGYDINMNKPNPWIRSNFMLRFATADSRKVFRIPASKYQHIDAIIGNSWGIDNVERDRVRENWDSLKPSKQRETRYMVTGNILQGMNQYKKGRLVQFTMKDGSIRKGILMPENWIKPEVEVVRIPITKGLNIIRALHVGDYVETPDGDIMIQKDYPTGIMDSYKLKVPASTKRGDKYYNDDDVRMLVHRGYFEQIADRMVASFDDSELPELLDMLQKKFGASIEVNAYKLGKAFATEEVESSYDQYSAPSAVKRRRGLSDPEPPLGMGSANMGARIKPEPIPGETPKPVWEMQLDLTKSIGQKVRYAKPERRTSIGSYTPSTGKLVIQFQEDLNLTAHEIGHALDDLIGITGPQAERIWYELQAEMSELWEYGSKPPKGHKDPERYRMREGVAEFIRAYIVNPEATRRRYPITHNWFMERLAPYKGAKEAIENFSRDVRVWYGSTAADKIKVGIHFGEKPSHMVRWADQFRRTGKNGEFNMTMFDRFSQKWLNFMHPAEAAWRWAKGRKQESFTDFSETAITDNFEIMARLLLGHNVKMENIMNRGMINNDLERVIDPVTKSPVSFSWKLEALPSFTYKDTEQYRQEALTYGTAERIVETVWKFQARQVRQDLASNFDVLPPLDILEKHPYSYKKFQAKIERILDMIDEGELNPDNVFLPEERYDFTDAVIAGVAQEGMTDYEIAKQAVAEYEALQETNPDRYNYIKEYNRRYRKISEAAINYYRQAGMISQDAYDQIKAENLHYVAMNRFFMLEPGDMLTEGSLNTDFYSAGKETTGLQPKQQIYALKGSRKLIKDPDMMQMEAVRKMIEAADVNHVVRTFAIALVGKREAHEGDVQRLSDIGWVSKQHNPQSIAFWIDGTKRYLVIRDKAVYDAFMGMKAKDSHILIKLAQIPPQILRNLIIHSVPFIIRNITRDIQQFLIVGTGKRYLRPKDLSIDKKARDEFELSGGGQFGFYLTNPRQFYRMQKILMHKVSKDPRRFIIDPRTTARFAGKKMFGWMSKSERVTRMLQYKAAFREAKKKHKLNDMEATMYAAYHTRDLLDFAVAGSIMKDVNRIVIFSNAAVQGLRKIYRSAKSNPGSFALSWALVSAVPAMLNSLLIYSLGTDEDKEEYLNMPDYMRDMFYLIPFRGGWLTIPKPFELGWAGSMTQRMVDAMLMGDDAFNRGWGQNAWHILFPFDAAGVMGGYSGFLQAAFNYDLFRQKHIIPPDEVNKSVALRNTHYASKFGRMMQEASDFFTKEEGHYKWDARKVDAFILAQGSYYGQYFLELMEQILPGEKQSRYRVDWADLGIWKDDPVYSAPDVQWMMQQFKLHPWLKEQPQYEQLNNMFDNYWSDDTQADEQKKELVDDKIRQFANETREMWEEENMFQEDIRRTKR